MPRLSLASIVPARFRHNRQLLVTMDFPDRVQPELMRAN